MKNQKFLIAGGLLLILMGIMIGWGKRPSISVPAFLFKSPPLSSDSPLQTSWGRMPLYFIENQGQLDREVAYSVQGKDKTLYFTSQGITFSLTDNTPKTTLEELLPHFSFLPKVEASLPDQSDPKIRWNLKLDFIGANPLVKPLGKDPTPTVMSYFKGTKDQWKAGLKTYSSIVYPELWPGIDLVYSGTVDQMKYTFVVKPGADPNRIKLAYRGITGMKVNDSGQLEVITPVKKFHDASPEAYQEMNGKRVAVSTSYALDSDANKDPRAYGFQVGSYDRAQPLIIDPAVFVYAGFIGGTSGDLAEGIAVDKDGNAYVAGELDGATNFPVNVGPDTSFNGGSVDAFVAKVKADGSALDYAGFIGGQQFDVGSAIAVDSQGNAYVMGVTGSNSTTDGFPALVGPVTTFGGGNSDAFVAKVSADGTQLLYAGYIGGVDDENSDDHGGIAVDKDGNAYVTGFTFSSEDPNTGKFPVKVGPDTTFNGFVDIFVSKVKADGSGFVYSGYIGGSDQEHGQAIAVDKDGNAYVTGDTSSSANFPLITGPGLTFGGGSTDAFVAKVKADGTGLVYSGYIGGALFDQGSGIAVDDNGNAYVTGKTDSGADTFPVTVGPDLTHPAGTDTDAFVAKVKADGSGFDYSGFIGGSDNDEAFGIGVDSAGNAYVVGSTGSDQNSFPVKEGPDLTFHGSAGNHDAFVAKVKADGSGFVYAGYIGGTGNDEGFAIAVDGQGNAYVAGATDSDQSSFPVKGGPSLIQNGGIDAFVAKISENIDLVVAKTASPNPVEIGNNVTYTITVTNNGAVTATGVTLTDPLPAGTTFVSASPNTCSEAGGTVTCNLPDLASGANSMVTIVVTPSIRGTLTNTATVKANENDENPSNDSASVDTTVNPKGTGGGGGGCQLDSGTKEGMGLTGWTLIGLVTMGFFYFFPRGSRPSTRVRR